MTDHATEIGLYVDQDLLTRAKGMLMLETGREPTDDEVVAEALQRMVDGETDPETDVDSDDFDLTRSSVELNNEIKQQLNNEIKQRQIAERAGRHDFEMSVDERRDLYDGEVDR